MSGAIYINITLSRRRRLTTVRSNDTLVDTSLNRDFFHVNQGVSMLSKLPPAGP